MAGEAWLGCARLAAGGTAAAYAGRAVVGLLRAIPFSLIHATAVAADQVPPCGLYTYRAEIVRVIDGDTVVADIDLGFEIWLRNEHLRLAGVEAPEKKSGGWQAATDALRARVEGRTLYVCTQRMARKDREARGSFGRYLVTIYDDGASVNDWLIDSGFARVFE